MTPNETLEIFARILYTGPILGFTIGLVLWFFARPERK